MILGIQFIMPRP